MNLKIKYSLIAATLLCTVHAKEINKLDVVTVIAQKVEENVQNVPIAMNVVDEFLIWQARPAALHCQQ